MHFIKLEILKEIQRYHPQSQEVLLHFGEHEHENIASGLGSMSVEHAATSTAATNSNEHELNFILHF